MDKYDQKEGTASDLLIFYMQTVWDKAGLNWNSDNASEIREIVDAIVNAAVAKATDEVNDMIEERFDVESTRQSYLKHA